MRAKQRPMVVSTVDAPRVTDRRGNVAADKPTSQMPMKDTSPEALELQTGVYRRLSPGERLVLAFELSVVARELAMSRLRRQHPDWTPADLMKELLRFAFLPESMPESLR